MMVFAAIDLQGGEVVQLVGGKAEALRVRLPDPLAVAQRWQEAGFQALHVIDLDAARGHGHNRDAIDRILEAVQVPVQVGGGVRELEHARALQSAGAARVIVGTRAIEDPNWLRRVSEEFPDFLVVAADVRDGQVVTHGWAQTTAFQLDEVLERLDLLPIAAILITDVSREGQMVGVNTGLFGRAVASTRHPVYCAGGIGNLSDLRALDRAGAAGAVLGMSLYTGAIEPHQLAGVFS
jgi:phosphoribosylformimino-5-aminoimidazole carboxamide ribotide isomerase